MAFSVSYIYQLQDRYSRHLDKINRSTDKFRKTANQARTSAAKFSQKMVSAQGTIATVASMIGGAAVLGTFTNFETSINKLNAVTLATDQQMARLRKTARDLGSTTQFSAGQAAQGMTFLAMAGLDTDQVLKAIPGTLQLAAAGGLDLASAADIATNVLAQMGLGVESLTRVNDNLARIQASANTSVFEAAEAMKNVGTSASSLGVTLEQTTALIGALANAGVKGGEAGTLLRNSMLRLVNPSRNAQKTFRKLGIDLREFVTPEGKIKDFSKLIDVLSKRGATTAQIFTIFEERGGRAIQALQKIGTPAIDKLTKTLEKAGGTAERMAKIQMRGLPGIILEMKSAIEAVTIALFKSGLDKFLMGVARGIANFARWLSTANPIVLKIVAALGLLAVVLPPILITIGLMASGFAAVTAAVTAATPVLTVVAAAFGLISAPVWATVAAVAAVSAAFYQAWKNWDVLVGAFQDAADNVLGKVKEKFEAIQNAVGGVKRFFGMGPEEITVTQRGVAAENARATGGTLNGRIDINAPRGVVKRAEMETSFPGNLGLNMAGAQ